MAEKQPKQTKRLLQTVAFHDKSYAPGDEDELEERLTPERAKAFAEADPPVIEGEWSPRGQGEVPMPRSRAAQGGLRLGQLTPGEALKPHPAEAELAELRERLKRLEEQQQTPAGGEGDGGHKGHGKGK